MAVALDVLRLTRRVCCVGLLSCGAEAGIRHLGGGGSDFRASPRAGLPAGWATG